MLLVRHLGELAPVEITIVRGVITLQSVYSNIRDDGIGYIALQSFTNNTNESLTEILKEMKQQGVSGIILDVRNNPGGLVSTTVDVASQFLEEGLVMFEVDGVGKRTDRPVRGDALLPDIPLVVLVNSLSGSGSEVLAGALQDHGRALLVGTTTYGKGSVNLLRRLSDGGGLYFTLARWHTPNGRLIEGDGLEPDVQVAGIPGPDGDPQAEKALELLQEQIARAGP
jgi:carboxyl-terminal processing protease